MYFCTIPPVTSLTTDNLCLVLCTIVLDAMILLHNKIVLKDYDKTYHSTHCPLATSLYGI